MSEVEKLLRIQKDRVPRIGEILIEMGEIDKKY